MPKVKKVIGLKGIKQFQKQPHEKPKWTTMLTYVNAAGFALPPLVIHKGKYHDSWRNHCPRQVMVRGSKKGYINKFLFAEYGKRLIYHLHAAGQLDKPNLILMDSHYSHVFNYCYMKMMFDKDINVMALEAHSSHSAQPLDKNPFSAFKQEFNFQMKRFNRSVGGRAITKQEFFPVFNIAWNRAMTPANIKAGFKRSGVLAPRHGSSPRWVVLCQWSAMWVQWFSFDVEGVGSVLFQCLCLSTCLYYWPCYPIQFIDLHEIKQFLLFYSSE